MIRRRLLLSMLNQYKWLPYSFEYLYHDLIPTTIDSKNVQNKLKLATIYGNSMVENQQCDIKQTNVNGSGVSASANGNTITYTSTGGGRGCYWHTLNIVSGHKYLLTCKLTQSVTASCSIYIFDHNYMSSMTETISLTANTKKEVSFIKTSTFTDNDTNTNISFYMQGTGVTPTAGDTLIVEDLQLIDLTQAYPFDTPTTLTDNRVQAILNRGYIPYNTGELKSVDIGEFSSEPFNIWNEQTELGRIDITDGSLIADNNRIRSVDYINILPTKTYYAKTPYTISLFFYDNNYNFITYQNVGGTTFTPPSNAKYLKFFISTSYGTTYNHDICINVSSSLNGTYKPHTQPQTISFKYQGGGVGTSHDTMEIGKENVVFTKDRALADLGQQTWTFIGGQGSGWWQTTISNMKYVSTNTQVGLAIADNYQPRTASGMSSADNNSLAVDTSNLKIRTNGNTDSSVKPTGTLEYQLATPQVITIPRNKLGVVDLGTLTYGSPNSYGRAVANAPTGIKLPSGANILANVYCSNYLTYTANQTYGANGKIGVSVEIDGKVDVKDDIFVGKTASEIQALLSGTYLFYETQDEVADIIDTIGVEAGGTFTANWFSWVENQLQKTTSTTYFNGNSGAQNFSTLTDVNGILTQTYHSTPSLNYQSGIISTSSNNRFDSYIGHKYLLRFKFRANINTMVRAYIEQAGYTKYFSINANTWYECADILSATGNKTNNYVMIVVEDATTLVSGNILEFADVQITDLTIGFPNGDIPTSISDPRIQYIINQGYIPTNTTGTLKSVDCEVLPNVDTKIKGK